MGRDKNEPMGEENGATVSALGDPNVTGLHEREIKEGPGLSRNTVRFRMWKTIFVGRPEQAGRA